jgi:hypothetical protein
LAVYVVVISHPHEQKLMAEKDDNREKARGITRNKTSQDFSREIRLRTRGAPNQRSLPSHMEGMGDLIWRRPFHHYSFMGDDLWNRKERGVPCVVLGSLQN